MKQIQLLLAVAAVLTFGTAQANNFSKPAYEGAKADIKANHKAARDASNSLSGNAKDICIEEAKGREQVALAQLEFNYTGASKDGLKVQTARSDARYALAKEKCDDLAGNAKDLCVREAKTARDKAQADIKLAKQVSIATDDAESARMQADYKLAAEKCASLAGDSKDACMASAKARYQR